MATGTLNENYGFTLMWEDVFTRYRFLKERYETFSQITLRDDVGWGVKDNCIHAREDVWNKIFQVMDVLISSANHI